MPTETKEDYRLATEGQVIAALREMFDRESYAFLPGVPDATGYGKNRTADALAMSLWPSRGLDLIGFEVKVARSDWLKELKAASKAESICRYCDRWYIVAGSADLVRSNELPSTWGLIAPRGGKLSVKTPAPQLAAQPMDRGFLAALLRRASEVLTDKAEIEAKVKQARHDGFKEGVESARNTNGYQLKSATESLEKLQKAVREFEAASGIKIDTWWGGRDIGEAAKFVMHGGLRHAEHSMAEVERAARSMLSDVEKYRAFMASDPGPTTGD
jgi:hypothetical protein